MAQWNELIADPVLINQLATGFDLNPLVARILANRGVSTKQEAQQFLQPNLQDLTDCTKFADMSAAVDRLEHAVIHNETVGIFGDYDVDGVTSTTLLSEFLEQLGTCVRVTIPDRLKEGYGLNLAGVQRLREGGAQLIVTVDCGVTNHDEVLAALKAGLDVIVVDHHTVPVELPKARAVVNPHRLDCEAGAKHLCAVGVVFHLCIALRQKLRSAGFFETRTEPNLLRMLDLVALGTVADVMPLISDNRILVHHGLKFLAKSPRMGLLALLQQANILPNKVNAGTLGFQLGPRINAAGRLERAIDAVELLRVQDWSRAQELASFLDSQNLERRRLEKEITTEAINEIQASNEHSLASVLVVYREHWHPGVVGIVASRLVERFGKPTLVIGANGKGSGRSISQLHLHEALCAVKDMMIGFGGHAHAVGVHIAPENISRFRDALVAQVSQMLLGKDTSRQLNYDASVNLGDVDFGLLGKLEQLQPFGRGNPEPIFRVNNVQTSDIRELKGGHLRGRFAGPSKVEWVAFGMGERMAELSGSIDLLAAAEVNEWQGVRKLQMRIRDVRQVATS